MMSLILFMWFPLFSAIPLKNEEWENYKLTFAKVYQPGEEAVRYSNWLKNDEQIKLHNADYESTYIQSHNQFSDMSDDEFTAAYGSCLEIPPEIANSTNAGFEPDEPLELPSTVNWVSKGYVTEVKTQGNCASCYAFSGTGALEGQWYKKHRNLVSLSEQQIVDCSVPYGNTGCKGGWHTKVWDYVKGVGGIERERDYPYHEKKSECKFSRSKVRVTCSGYVNLKRRSEDALTKAIASVGPIAVAIDASRLGFRRYKSGVFFDHWCSGTRVNHAVLAVGYGTENGQDYYLVKNSWGAHWGLDGYIKMARNRKNACGIATYPGYPTV